MDRWGAVAAGFAAYLTTTGKSAATAQSYSRCASLFWRWCDEHETDAREVGPHAIRAYLAELMDRLANNTVPLRLAALRSWFAYCRFERWRDDDPCSGMSIKWHTVKPRRPFSITEMNALLKGCRNDRDKAMIIVGYSCGLRVAEVVGIRAEDIDFDRELVTVRGKGGIERYVPIDDTLAMLLKSYALRGAIWRTRTGQPMSVKRAQRNMEEIAKRAGVEAHWHRLRVTYANDALDAGMQLEELQVMMGHKNLETTRHYAGAAIHRRAYARARTLHLADRLVG